MPRAFALAIVILVVVSPPAAVAECDLDDQLHLRTASSGDLEPIAVRTGIDLVSVAFGEDHFEVTNRHCKNSRLGHFPAYTAIGWLISIPEDAKIRVFRVREAALRTVRDGGNGRYSLSRRGHYIFDSQRDTQMQLSSSIAFVMENIGLFPRLGDNALLVSGPFWRQVDHLVEPRGFWREGDDNDYEFNYDPAFNARWVVCVDGDKLKLFRPRDVKHARSTCRKGFQAGPAFYEPSQSGLGRAGISGSSGVLSRRNILFSVQTQSVERQYLWAPVSEITAFDTMVLLHKVQSRMREESADVRGIAWAVGLVDGKSLSGPIAIVDGVPIVLSDTGGATGGVVHFSW